MKQSSKKIGSFVWCGLDAIVAVLFNSPVNDYAYQLSPVGSFHSKNYIQKRATFFFVAAVTCGGWIIQMLSCLKGRSSH